MLRHLVVDLLVLAFVVWAVWADVGWARWIIGGYAVLMTLMKLLAMRSGIQFARPADAPPAWAHHLIYGATLALLLSGGWLIVAALWAVFWAVMALASRTTERATGA
jgi:hypothetical protein